MIVLLLLGVIWAAVLLPPWLQNRRERRPIASMASFHRQLWLLERTSPGYPAPTTGGYRSVTVYGADDYADEAGYADYAAYDEYADGGEYAGDGYYDDYGYDEDGDGYDEAGHREQGVPGVLGVEEAREAGGVRVMARGARGGEARRVAPAPAARELRYGGEPWVSGDVAVASPASNGSAHGVRRPDVADDRWADLVEARRRSVERSAEARRRLAGYRRRRRVLATLLVVAVLTALPAALIGGLGWWVGHAVADLLLVTYVVLLVQRQRRTLEREEKVHYLPPIRAPRPPVVVLGGGAAH